MASLLQDPRTGHFYAQFYDGHRRPQRKTVPLKTKRRRTAERALHRYEEAYALGTFDPWAPPPECHEVDDLSTLGAAVSAYLLSCSHLKPKTIQSYKDVLRPFLCHMGDRFPVRRVSALHVLEWLQTTQAGDVTRRKYVNHLGYLFRFLVRRGEMEKDVSKEVPLRKVPEQAPKAMKQEEVDRLVASILQYNEGQDRADFSWLAKLILFNVHVGLRRGELIHLRWKHIDLERRMLRVVNSAEFTTKSVKERTIPLSDQAHGVLRELRNRENEGYVFQLRGQKLNYNTITHYFRRFRRMAGLPEHVNLHSTRHTFGTWLAERGTPVVVIQKLMGHSTVKTTERYMSVRADVAEQWVRQVFSH